MFADFFDFLMGWPLILYTIGISVICSVAFKWIQIRDFIYAWKLILFPPKQVSGLKADMTPFQAFLNTLSTNLGNGSIAGVATALYSGGPGSAIWMLIIGILLMAVRFAEVYLSVLFSVAHPNSKLGGPLLYLRAIIGGRFIAPLYGIFCLLFAVAGSAIQSNSISLTLHHWNIPLIATATVLLLFMAYVIFGGAARIVKISDAIVPLKVLVFFASTFIVLGYHWQSLIPAMLLMIKAAFSAQAAVGGVLGFSVAQAMRMGILRSILATESGVGTAAILFSATGSTEPKKDGLIAMLSTFISTLVCFIIALCIVASGVWDSGLTSTPLTIASFSTVFGWLGGWVVGFLSISFGLGVLVSYAYITRELWKGIAGGNLMNGFIVAYCLCIFGGALISPTLLFSMADIVNAGTLVLNLFGILCLIPLITQSLNRK